MTSVPAAKLRGYALLLAALVWGAIALHRPELVALAAPFGLLLAARGAVYSYYEVASDHRMDDEEWQGALSTAHRPAWTVPDP